MPFPLEKQILPHISVCFPHLSLNRIPVQLVCVLHTVQGPHSHILVMGGLTEVYILYPQKFPTLFSIPKKFSQCFCIFKFYYLSPENQK